MTDYPYQYVIIRCVPRVDRGECINVGVVLYAESAGFLASSSFLDEARIRAIAPDFDTDSLRAALAKIDETCADAIGSDRPEWASAGKRFGWLSAPRSTVLQPSPVHGGHTRDPAAQLESLMRTLVR